MEETFELDRETRMRHLNEYMTQLVAISEMRAQQEKRLIHNTQRCAAQRDVWDPEDGVLKASPTKQKLQQLARLINARLAMLQCEVYYYTALLEIHAENAGIRFREACLDDGYGYQDFPEFIDSIYGSQAEVGGWLRDIKADYALDQRMDLLEEYIENAEFQARNIYQRHLWEEYQKTQPRTRPDWYVDPEPPKPAADDGWGLEDIIDAEDLEAIDFLKGIRD